MATASLWLGVLSIFCSVVAAVPSVLAGVIALCNIFTSQGKATGKWTAAGGILLSSLTTAVWVPFLLHGRERAHRVECVNRVRQLSLAIEGYANARGAVPPAYSIDDQGRPVHSWRTLAAENTEAFDGEGGYGDRLDPALPWDSPRNHAVAQFPLSEFHSFGADHESRETDFVGVVGPGFVFDGSKSTKLEEIKDGPENTILFVEMVDSGIPWIEPRDVTLPDMLARMGQRAMSRHKDGFHVAMCDGSVRFLEYDKLDANLFKAMLTIAGGEKVDAALAL